MLIRISEKEFDLITKALTIACSTEAENFQEYNDLHTKLLFNKNRYQTMGDLAEDLFSFLEPVRYEYGNVSITPYNHTGIIPKYQNFGVLKDKKDNG